MKDELCHYGVMGMRWGVRNADTLRKYGARGAVNKKIGNYYKKKGSSRKAAKYYTKANASKAAKKMLDNTSKEKRITMTDEELDRYINRLTKQKQLRNLRDSELQPGKAAAKKAVATIGKTVATAAVTSAAMYVVGTKLTGGFIKGDEMGKVVGKNLLKRAQGKK